MTKSRGLRTIVLSGKYTLRQCGPCPTCGLMFQSRGDKKFCSLPCYVASARFVDMQQRAAKLGTAARKRGAGTENLTGEWVPCLECGTDVYRKPSEISTRKYCSTSCYRKYMTKRFDRFIANPERIALPQNYDEFLTGDLLNCLVDDCGWKGHHLSLHMNQAHGITADQFKKMAGFNLGSGIISQPLRDTLEARPLRGVALPEYEHDTKPPQPNGRYISREAMEHRHKIRALKLAEYGGEINRACRGCGKSFAQTTPFGRAIYCSEPCRDFDYKKKICAKDKDLVCDCCGLPFKGTRQQELRAQKKLPIACCYECRQRRAGRLSRGTWVTLDTRRAPR